MVVRRAMIDDLTAYVRLAQAFHTASPMRETASFDVEGYSAFYVDALENPLMALWVAELDGAVVGITGALFYSLYFSPSTKIVQELWWWLNPDARGSGLGKQMFLAIEDWAVAQKASAVFMIALENTDSETMSAVYERFGYRPIERTFMKGVR